MAEENKEKSTKEKRDELDAMLVESPEEDARKELEAQTDQIIANMQKCGNSWGLNHKSKENVRMAMSSLAMTNGMYSRVPLVCKGDECPYANQCQLHFYGRCEVGSYCEWEIAQIELRARQYSQDLDYDSASFTDRNLMSELIMLDIMLERCKALLAKDGTPVIEMAIGIDQDGNEVRQPAVSKAWEAYEKVSKKRDQTYQLLMMTRKDKKSLGKDEDSQSLTDTLRDVIDSSGITV